MSKLKAFQKRKKRTRDLLKSQANRPRLLVFRSNKYIYSQIIDEKNGKVIVSTSDVVTKSDKKKMTKTERASLVGENIASKALKMKVREIVFDKSGYKYHGRVKALAEGARKGGLKF